MSYRDEFGGIVELDTIPGFTGETKNKVYAVCEGMNGYYIAEITPNKEKIVSFKIGQLLHSGTKLNQKKNHFFAHFSPFRKTLRDIVDDDYTVTSRSLGVLDKTCIMEPGSTFLEPIYLSENEQKTKLIPYINSDSNNFFTFEHLDEKGKSRYFLMYDENVPSVVEISGSLYALHLIQSGRFNLLNGFRNHEGISAALDCFDVRRAGDIGRNDEKILAEDIKKCKRISDIIGKRLK